MWKTSQKNSNIATHAWNNLHDIDFNNVKIIYKGCGCDQASQQHTILLHKQYRT